MSSLKLRDAPWRSVILPEPVRRPATMLLDEELQLLYFLSSYYFRNFGYIVDGGCFLGGSTVALAEGVRANRHHIDSPRPQIIHSYDLFEVEGWTVGKFFPEGTDAGSDFYPLYRRNVRAYDDLIELHRGDVTRHGSFTLPIEILFIDFAKHWTVCDFVTRNFFPSLIPGHSIVIQQDYLFESHTAWLHVTMEYLAPYFEIVGDTGLNSVVFLNTKPIPDSVLDRNIVQSLSRAEIEGLCDSAVARFSGRQRKVVENSRNHFLQMLKNEPNWKP